MGSLDEDAGLVPTLPEDVPKDNEMGDGESPTESGGKSTDTTEEPAMASPRMIPIPESPANSGEPVLPPISEDSGKTSVSFDQQCAPFQVPDCMKAIMVIFRLAIYAIHANHVAI